MLDRGTTNDRNANDASGWGTRTATYRERVQSLVPGASSWGRARTAFQCKRKRGRGSMKMKRLSRKEVFAKGCAKANFGRLHSRIGSGVSLDRYFR